MLICGIFMMSLSFSVLVEALQTLVHINHFDEMHHALSVLFFGAAGLLLNGVCYLLIGGYTFHQGSYMFLTESGDVVLSKVVVPDIVNQGGRRLSRTRTTMPSPPSKQRQGFWEMIRDTSGCVLVIVCALIVYFTEKNIAKFIDPGISLLSATSLMILSYPYMKESCLILLQTIPGSINIDALEKDLIRHFPDIVNVHDFHVWQLTATKIISTVHIIFQNQEEYRKIMDDIKKFLVENGITQVTIQPEFFTKFEKKSTELCLMPCQRKECQLSHCCPPCPKVKETKVESNEGSFPDLRSIRIVNTDFAKTTDCLSATESQSPDNI